MKRLLFTGVLLLFAGLISFPSTQAAQPAVVSGVLTREKEKICLLLEVDSPYPLAAFTLYVQYKGPVTFEKYRHSTNAGTLQTAGADKLVATVFCDYSGGSGPLPAGKRQVVALYFQAYGPVSAADFTLAAEGFTDVRAKAGAVTCLPVQEAPPHLPEAGPSSQKAPSSRAPSSRPVEGESVLPPGDASRFSPESSPAPVKSAPAGSLPAPGSFGAAASRPLPVNVSGGAVGWYFPVILLSGILAAAAAVSLPRVWKNKKPGRSSIKKK